MKKSKKKQIVWVITATSESGDEFGPAVLGHRPTDEDIAHVLEAMSPDDFEEGSLYATVTEAVVDE
jgi:hypothetical protein